MDGKKTKKKVTEFDEYLDTVGKFRIQYNTLTNQYTTCLQQIQLLNNTIANAARNGGIASHRDPVLVQNRKALKLARQDKETHLNQLRQLLNLIKEWKKGVEKLSAKSVEAVNDLFSQLNYGSSPLDNASKQWKKLLTVCQDLIDGIEDIVNA